MEPNTQILKKHYTADLRPAYYDSFQCLADKCQVDCCSGWNIQFNRKDYLKIRQQKGSNTLNHTIKQALTRITDKHSDLYATFRMDENRCPFLTEEHLCRLQLECGHDALPNVCKRFPRGKYYSPSGYCEYSLSFSCEAVLEILWNLPAGIDFVSDPLSKTEHITKGIVVENMELASHFQEIRALCIGLLQDRRFSVRERILLMGIFLQKLTAEDADVSAWLIQTKQLLQQPELEKMAKTIFASVTEEDESLILSHHLRTLLTLPQKLNHPSLQSFQQLLEELFVSQTEVNIFSNVNEILIHTEKLHKAKADFYTTFTEQEYFFENLAVSAFFLMAFPTCTSEKKLWESYVNFCNLYSLLRFAAIVSCLQPMENMEAAKKALFYGILYIGRNFLHEQDIQKFFLREFFSNQSTSLAHMAILLSL